MLCIYSASYHTVVSYSQRYMYFSQSALNAMEEIHNPCMLNGARLTYQTDEIFSLCVRNETSSDVFGYGYSPSDEASNYTFIGTGEPANCSKIIHEVFNVTKCKDSGVCINTTYLWPPVNNTGTFLVGSCTALCSSEFCDSVHVLNPYIHVACAYTCTCNSIIHLAQLPYTRNFSL